MKQTIPWHKWNEWIMDNDFLLEWIWKLKPYYEDYQSLLFYEELDKVKFSLSDQYLCYYNSFNNIGYSIFLIQESKHKKLAFKLT